MPLASTPTAVIVRLASIHAADGSIAQTIERPVRIANAASSASVTPPHGRRAPWPTRSAAAHEDPRDDLEDHLDGRHGLQLQPAAGAERDAGERRAEGDGQQRLDCPCPPRAPQGRRGRHGREVRSYGGRGHAG